MSEMKMITSEMCKGSFTDIAKPGDFVAEEIVDDFLNCVPPATHRVNLIQYGEPYSDAWDEKNNQYRPIYLTFSKKESNWQYCGTCFIGETTDKPSRLYVTLDHIKTKGDFLNE